MSKSSLEIIGSFIAALSFALALLWLAPAHAGFLEDIFGVREAALHPANSGWRRPHLRRQLVRAYFTTPEGARSMVASYYGGGERLNAHTANGETFRAGGYTAAHRTLPFGTPLTVCLHGCVTVRVNDRGPAAWTGRSLDLSRGAARAIGMIGAGVARVSVRIGG